MLKHDDIENLFAPPTITTSLLRMFTLQKTKVFWQNTSLKSNSSWNSLDEAFFLVWMNKCTWIIKCIYPIVSYLPPHKKTKTSPKTLMASCICHEVLPISAGYFPTRGCGSWTVGVQHRKTRSCPTARGQVASIPDPAPIFWGEGHRGYRWAHGLCIEHCI